MSQDLSVEMKSAKPAPAKVASGNRLALHAGAKLKSTRPGEIRHHGRYTRIKQSLAELELLLREVLASLEIT